MNRHLNRAANLLLLLLGVLPQIYLIADSLHCSINLSLLVWVGILCVLVWVAASFRNGLLIGMPLSALALYLAYRSYDANPSVQLVDLFDRMTGVYYENIYAPGSTYVLNSGVESHSLVLVFLAFLLAAYLASALTSHIGRIPLALLGTLPCVGACLAVNGTPSSLVVLPFVLFVILLFVSGGQYWEDSKAGKALFTALLPVTILLCILLLIYSPERYQFDERDIAASQRFDPLSFLRPQIDYEYVDVDEQNGSHYLVLPEDGGEISPVIPRNTPNSGWGNMVAGMDLTQEFDFSVYGNTVFYASSDNAGLLYLRMLSYGDYTGTGWLNLPENITGDSLSFSAYAVSSQKIAVPHRLSIQSENALPYLCLPYYTPQDNATEQYASADGLSDYVVRYNTIPGNITSLKLPDAYDADEADYRAYAHETYTRLPESTRSAMEQFCARTGFAAADPDIIGQVADHVKNAVRYDLTTAPYPTDDYSVWFLTQAESGYCIHYATAAVVLYRSLGIPARITVGYLLNAVPGQSVEVTEADAHAWAEVYLDGLGWIPVEVTGSSAQLPDSAAFSDPVGTIVPTENGENTASEKGHNSSAEVPAATPEPLPVGIIQAADNEAEIKAPTAPPRYRVWLVLLALLLLPLVFLLLWYTIRRNLVLRSYAQEDRGKAAVALYHAAQYAVRLGAEMPDEIKTCAEKAHFSTHEISEEELRRNLQLLRVLIEDLYSQLNLWKKIRLKYWNGLL